MTRLTLFQVLKVHLLDPFCLKAKVLFVYPLISNQELCP